MNMDLLKARMIQSHTSAEELSKAIGISKASFYRKISAKTEFTRDEISDISRILSLDTSDVMAIFLTIRCPKRHLTVKKRPPRGWRPMIPTDHEHYSL